MPKPRKNDSLKIRTDLLPPWALLDIAEIMTFGANKYSDYNYRNGNGLNWSRVYAALQRHILAWYTGEDLDDESGKSHLAHAGCCLIMLMDLVDHEKGKDDRPIV